MSLPEAISVQWASLPAILFVSLSALAVIAGAVAVVRASYAKAQIEGLRGDRDDLTKRLEEQRVEARECSSQVVALRSELAAEVSKREALEAIVTGKRELQTVLSTLEAHDSRAANIEAMIKQLIDRK